MKGRLIRAAINLALAPLVLLIGVILLPTLLVVTAAEWVQMRWGKR